MYSGGVPQVIKEVFTQKINGKTMPLSKAIKNNRLFFSAKIMTNTAGTEYDEGIWSFGRKNANSPFALTLDIIDENVTTAGIQAFGTAANYFFITHSSDGSIDKTNDAATYAFSSIYESLIFDFGEPAKQKQLRGVSVTSASIPSGGTVTLKYKKDSDTNWTTIGSFANTGLSPVYARDFINIESTAAEFSAGKEYKFRVESTGGAEITSIKIKAIILNAPN
jgi:hypothetical protein